jgi:SagB-type dehydrogenase family enzyme
MPNVSPSNGQAAASFQLWSLREDVHVEVDPGDGTVTLHTRWGETTVRRPGPMVGEVLRRMRRGPISLENVLGEYAEEPNERARLFQLLDRLQYLVVRSFGADAERPMISVVPLAPQARFRPVALSPDAYIRLSRFALVRTDGSNYFSESPLSLHRVLIHRAEVLWLIGSLGRATRLSDAAVGWPHSDLPVADMIRYLAAAGVVVQAETKAETEVASVAERPVFAEDVESALARWSPVDLMFHTRSTLGRHDHDFGWTYPLGERHSPEPVVKPPSPGHGIPLYRPHWENLIAADPPLTVALEGRRSTRNYSENPLIAHEIGELLYRTARVRSLIDSPDPDRPLAQLSDRPYPSGGASFELELYLTVNECVDIPRGVYHYDPFGHRLELVNTDTAIVDELLENGRLAADLSGLPPVLITITARFGRLSWKYDGLSYSLVLKHVGVMMQSLYLVSAAMGLAACALGSGDIDASARAFGTDWRLESSVGEFVIGRMPNRTPEVSAEHPAGGHPANDASWADRATASLGVPERDTDIPSREDPGPLSATGDQ